MSKIVKYANLASGDVIPFSIESDYYVDQDSDIEELRRMIDLNYITPSFRIYVLYPDETINFEIPKEIIKAGGSYNENYQNGQRRTLSFTVYNHNGDYTPTINTLWAGTRLRLDIGVEYNGTKVWFEKGYFVISKANPSLTSNGQEVAISANDKFSLFENSTGRLENTFEIPEGQDIAQIIRTIQQLELGDGSIFDPKDLIINEKLKGKRTQVAITKNAGDTYGNILIELATQLSAEIFYNANGILTLMPITEVSEDKDKAIIYSFNADQGDLSQLNFDYDYNSIVNRIVVVGNSKNGGVYKATAINNDSRSPLCYQRIGYRTGNIINDSNIYSDLLAEERAEYELRQKLILKTTTTASILFNPFLSINNLITIDSDFFNLKHDKFLLQSISFNIDFSGQMNITFTNILNLSTDIEIISGITPKKVPDVDLTGLEYPLSAYTRNKNLYNDKLYFTVGDSPVEDINLLVEINGRPRPYGQLCFIYAAVDDKYFIYPDGYENYWHNIGMVDNIRYYWVDLRGYMQANSYVDNSTGGLRISDPTGSGSGILIDYIYAINDIGEFRFDNVHRNTGKLLYKNGINGAIGSIDFGGAGEHLVAKFRTQNKIYYTPYEYTSGLTVGKGTDVINGDGGSYSGVTTWVNAYEVVRTGYNSVIDGSTNYATGIYQFQKSDIELNFDSTINRFSINYEKVVPDEGTGTYDTLESVRIVNEPVPGSRKYVLKDVYNASASLGVLTVYSDDVRYVADYRPTIQMAGDVFPSYNTSPGSFNVRYRNHIQYSTKTISTLKRTVVPIIIGVGVGVEAVVVTYYDAATGVLHDKERITTDRTQLNVPINTDVTYYGVPASGYTCSINVDNPATVTIINPFPRVLAPASNGWHKVASCDITMRGEETYDLSTISGVKADESTKLNGTFYCVAKKYSFVRYGITGAFKEENPTPFAINNVMINETIPGSPTQSIDSNITFGPSKCRVITSDGTTPSWTDYQSKLGSISKTTLKCYSKHHMILWMEDDHACMVTADIYQIRDKYEQK